MKFTMKLTNFSILILLKTIINKSITYFHKQHIFKKNNYAFQNKKLY